MSKQIELEQLKNLAKLSKLQFTDEEYAELQGEFSEIISFANRINELVEGDTTTVKEAEAACVEYADLRADLVEPSLESQKILSNVQSENGYFAVKRVVK